MKPLQDYKLLQPGDVVYPGFSSSNESRSFNRMITLGSDVPAYVPHVVVNITEEHDYFDGKIIVVTPLGDLRWFSARALLFVD